MRVYSGPTKIIHAPFKWEKPFNNKNPYVFLAGNCSGEDWRADLTAVLCDNHFDGTILNPKRNNWDELSISEKYDQVCWEHACLQKSDGIVFWFGKDTISPVTLIEFGRWSYAKSRSKQQQAIMVGLHPEYPLKEEVKLQLKLLGVGYPPIPDNLLDLAENVCAFGDPYL